jgi:hypothetical protein
MWRLYLGLIALTIIVLSAILALQSISHAPRSFKSTPTPKPPLQAYPLESLELPTSNTSTQASTGEGVGSTSSWVEVADSSLELSVNWRFIVDEGLFRELVARIESYGPEYFGMHPSDIRVLELLKEDPRVIAILEVNIALTNRGPESVYVLCWGGYFYFPRNELVEILKVHDTRFLFTYVSLEPVKGEVAVGGMAALAALVTVKLKPGDSINNMHYFVIKKPSPEEPFIAKLHVKTVSICKVYDVDCKRGVTSKHLETTVDIKFG